MTPRPRVALALVLLLQAGCGGVTRSPLRAVSTRAPAASGDWWNGAVVYEVFVRSFRDSDGDGKGDLAGLAEKLDHLNDGDPATDTDLGVDAIWLMPVFESPSYHGYDVVDYDSVERDYGTLDAFDALVAACHARGIKVVLDLVPNHTSSEHPWFQEAASSPASPRRDWYVWSPSDPGWAQPWNPAGKSWYPGGGAWYYALFSSRMPDLNWRSPEVRAQISAIAGRWLDRGVDGFRLDAVRHLAENGPGPGQSDQPETHAALRELSSAVRAARPDALVVGEAWADVATIATYLGSTEVVPTGDELPLAFDFPLAEAIVSGVSSGDAAPIARALDAVAGAYPPGVGDAPFLTNHDQERVASRLGGDPAKLRLAASILLTLQGTPFLYYGEEIGLRNGTCPGDECKRTPLPWDGSGSGGFTDGTPWWALSPGTGVANVTAQTGDTGSLLSRYRTLIRARRASPALSRGGTTRFSGEDHGILAFLRTDPAETVLVAHGVGASAAEATIPLAAGAVEPILVDPGASLAKDGDAWKLAVPARGSGVWRLVAGTR